MVQVLINDLYSSVSTPNKELKASQCEAQQPGKVKNYPDDDPVQADLFVNLHLEVVVEPETFEVIAGGSSHDQDLSKTRFIVVP